MFQQMAVWKKEKTEKKFSVKVSKVGNRFYQCNGPDVGSVCLSDKIKWGCTTALRGKYRNRIPSDN